jgi:hypothetical protein
VWRDWKTVRDDAASMSENYDTVRNTWEVWEVSIPMCLQCINIFCHFGRRHPIHLESRECITS